ncbi:MAG: hypothetical protein P4N24_03600 [Acidobacteriota bacterium]|nr:hypothetical protein [Acidobacteriota bacterium]
MKNHARRLSRRNTLKLISGFLGGGFAVASGGMGGKEFRLSSFTEDVTPPVGNPLFNGRPERATAIVDRLEANGLVLSGSGKPIVLVAVDWCEIRNESYERWRTALAEAAATDKERVLVSCVHQHDAAYSDVVAQKLLKANHVAQDLCDPEFDERTVERVASTLRNSLAHSRSITHIGTGQGKVEMVASNRRYVTPDGKVSWGRVSAERDPVVRNMPIGLIDPWLKTLSFWNGEQPLAAMSCYSTHPMAHYGKGEVSCDFPGLARAQRRKEMPSVAQVYFSGCSGDTMAGKFNDGNPRNRPILAERLHQGMLAAWNSTRRHPLNKIGFRCVPLKLEPRHTPGFSGEDFRRTLADNSQPEVARFDAALGLSWRQRADSGHHIDVPSIDFGPAQIVLMPAESFVQYQLWAQALRPESFVMTLGYGECAPGYIPTAKDAAEGYNDSYSWIAFPECEATMRQALAAALKRDDSF